MLGVSVVVVVIFFIFIFVYYDVSILFNVERNVMGFECVIVKLIVFYRVMYVMYNGIMLLVIIGILIIMVVLYMLIFKFMMKRSVIFKV